VCCVCVWCTQVPLCSAEVRCRFIGLSCNRRALTCWCVGCLITCLTVLELSYNSTVCSILHGPLHWLGVFGHSVCCRCWADHMQQCSVQVGMIRSCLYFTVCTGFVHQTEYRSSWQYSHFSVWKESHQHIWLTVYSMSPIFQVDNVCVSRHQRILPYHRHVLKQLATERFALWRQKPRTVFRQKWRHQWHCRHININLNLPFFAAISRHVMSPHFSHIDVQWLQFFCICSLKFLIDWLIVQSSESCL